MSYFARPFDINTLLTIPFKTFLNGLHTSLLVPFAHIIYECILMYMLGKNYHSKTVQWLSPIHK